MITGKNLARYAMEFVGVPWMHQGRTRRGVDCVGLIIVCARDLGLLDDNFEVDGYSPRPSGQMFMTYFRAFCTPVKWEEMQEGDVLLFRNNRFPCHCGLVTKAGADKRFIHSLNDATDTGTVNEQALHADWVQNCTHVYRFKRVK